jgi:hypothetical protein
MSKKDGAPYPAPIKATPKPTKAPKTEAPVESEENASDS